MMMTAPITANRFSAKRRSVAHFRRRATPSSGLYSSVWVRGTARAVAALSTLVEYLLPLVRRGGLAVIYKGAGAPQELTEARKAIELLGGEVLRLAPVKVPHLDEQRFILLIKKQRGK